MRTNVSDIFKLRLEHAFVSKREKLIHALVWLVGWVIINLPMLDLTIGEFYGGDFSLWFPSFTGMVCNAYLFYAVSVKVGADLPKLGGKLFLELGILFIGVLLLESLIDIAYDRIWYRKDFSAATGILIANLVLNLLLFFVPALAYGIVRGGRKMVSRTTKKEKIAVKDGLKFRYFSPSEVRYLESSGNYVVYHTLSGKFLERNSLNQAMHTLPDEFIQCHRSFVVNRGHITQVSSSQVTVGTEQLPLGRKHKKTFELKFGA